MGVGLGFSKEKLTRTGAVLLIPVSYYSVGNGRVRQDTQTLSPLSYLADVGSSPSEPT